MIRYLLIPVLLFRLAEASAVQAQPPREREEPDTTPPSLHVDPWPEKNLGTGGYSSRCIPGGGTATLTGWAVDHDLWNRGPVRVEVEVTRRFNGEGDRREPVVRTYRPAVDPKSGAWSVEGIELGDADSHLWIVVTATDQAGNRERTGLGYDIDAEPPRVELQGTGGQQSPGLTPAPEEMRSPPWRTDLSFLDVQVHDNPAREGVARVITLDGKPFDPWERGSIPDGVHVFAASATDCAGHTTSAHWVFRLDGTGPRLRSTTPPEGATTAKCRIRGVTDPDVVSVKIDFADATLEGARFFLDPMECVRPGIHSFDITLKDQLGNESTYERTFNYQPEGPRARVYVPEVSNYMIEGETFHRPIRPRVGCGGDPKAEAILTLDDKPIAPLRLIAANGPHVLKVTCRDELGRTSSAEASFVMAWGDEEPRE